MKTESKTEINNFKKETINDVKNTKNELKSNIKSMIENKFYTNDFKTNKNELKVKDIKEDPENNISSDENLSQAGGIPRKILSDDGDGDQISPESKGGKTQNINL